MYFQTLMGSRLWGRVVSTVLLEVKAERQLCSLEQKGGYLGARFLSSEEQTADAGGDCLTSRWRTEQVGRRVLFT